MHAVYIKHYLAKVLFSTWSGSCKEDARWRPWVKPIMHFFSGNFSFYLESHWQLNNVEVNVVQLQDLQGFLQRGTHQLWGVAGIPQLGRQEQALFRVPGGTVSILQLTPLLHTHTPLSF